MCAKLKIIPLLLLAVSFIACNKAAKPVAADRPAFSSDSAYAFIERQMAFGPRVPNSKSHLDCAAWLVRQLRKSGAQVELQKGTLQDYAGRLQPIINIIGHFVPDSVDANKEAILLCAHYDTRAWADEEPLYEDRTYNVPGANDGASGVGVLLEVARQISNLQSATCNNKLSTPVDIIFFDYEDQGTPSLYTGVQRENTWCLGSQLFAAHYTERLQQTELQRQYSFGILLDMVGSPDAIFPKEMYSLQYAQNYVELIWRKAHQLGYGRYFLDKMCYPITDDHYYLNMAGIPCVDIIHYDAGNETGFASWWHTRQDDMRNIDKSTLQAVGEVIMAVIE